MAFWLTYDGVPDYLPVDTVDGCRSALSTAGWRACRCYESVACVLQRAYNCLRCLTSLWSIGRVKLRLHVGWTDHENTHPAMLCGPSVMAECRKTRRNPRSSWSCLEVENLVVSCALFWFSSLTLSTFLQYRIPNTRKRVIVLIFAVFDAQCCRYNTLSGAGTNLKVGGVQFLVVLVHFFGSKSTMNRFGERFGDGQYSLVSFLFTVRLYSRFPVRSVPSHFLKWGTWPRALWSRHHCI